MKLVLLTVALVLLLRQQCCYGQQQHQAEEATCSGQNIFNFNFDGLEDTNIPFVAASGAAAVGPQGLPGKRGPQGAAGVKGEKGSTGDVGKTGDKGQGFNLTEIQEMKDKLEQMEEMKEKLQQMQESLDRCRQRTTGLEQRLKPEIYPPPSCADISPNHGSGLFKIRPSSSVEPFQVYCNFTNSPVTTEIGHDSEGEVRVKGFENAKSYSRNINYPVSIQQIVALIDHSDTCKQHINYKCFGSLLLKSGKAAWYNRNGQEMSYWGGSTTSGHCACGDIGTCVDNTYKCNCDKNDNVLREDGGYLTEKNSLPVTVMKFGDTGDSSEYGRHQLGKLICQ